MASDGFQEHSSVPREETGKNPTDRGKRGAKINLLVDERGAPLLVQLTGANRHANTSAVDLIVSIALKRPAQKEQHLCADKAYDASEVRELRLLRRRLHHPHQGQPQKERGHRIQRPNPENKEDSHGEKRANWSWHDFRSLRTRWSKKAENWLALIQLACAHVLLNGGFRIEFRTGRGPNFCYPSPAGFFCRA